MRAKWKRIVVPLEVKLQALNRIEKEETIKKVAADLGVGEITVGDWKRKKNYEDWRI